MEAKTCKITLADGTEIDGLRMNGNNYISDAPIAANVFDGNCSPVVINDGENDEFHENMELVQVARMGGEYWFVLRDLSAAELAQIKLQADIDYIAAMTGVEL